MISAHLSEWKQIPGAETHPVWSAAFRWIEEHAENAEDGWFELGVGGVRIGVMSYHTKARVEALYEAHRKVIDVQYTMEGAEGIEYTPTCTLEPLEAYDAEMDVQFYQTPARSEGRVDNLPGRFTVFFPEDAHLPQLVVPGCTSVRKLVVKIPLNAVS